MPCGRPDTINYQQATRNEKWAADISLKLYYQQENIRWISS